MFGIVGNICRVKNKEETCKVASSVPLMNSGIFTETEKT